MWSKKIEVLADIWVWDPCSKKVIKYGHKQRMQAKKKVFFRDILLHFTTTTATATTTRAQVPFINLIMMNIFPFPMIRSLLHVLLLLLFWFFVAVVVVVVVVVVTGFLSVDVIPYCSQICSKNWSLWCCGCGCCKKRVFMLRKPLFFVLSDLIFSKAPNGTIFGQTQKFVNRSRFNTLNKQHSISTLSTFSFEKKSTFYLTFAREKNRHRSYITSWSHWQPTQEGVWEVSRVCVCVSLSLRADIYSI
jgi:hypothetical protein